MNQSTNKTHEQIKFVIHRNLHSISLKHQFAKRIKIGQAKTREKKMKKNIK